MNNRDRFRSGRRDAMIGLAGGAAGLALGPFASPARSRKVLLLLTDCLTRLHSGMQ